MDRESLLAIALELLGYLNPIPAITGPSDAVYWLTLPLGIAVTLSVAHGLRALRVPAGHIGRIAGPIGLMTVLAWFHGAEGRFQLTGIATSIAMLGRFIEGIGLATGVREWLRPRTDDTARGVALSMAAVYALALVLLEAPVVLVRPARLAWALASVVALYLSIENLAAAAGRGLAQAGWPRPLARQLMACLGAVLLLVTAVDVSEGEVFRRLVCLLAFPSGCAVSIAAARAPGNRPRPGAAA